MHNLNQQELQSFLGSLENFLPENVLHWYARWLQDTYALSEFPVASLLTDYESLTRADRPSPTEKTVESIVAFDICYTLVTSFSARMIKIGVSAFDGENSKLPKSLLATSSLLFYLRDTIEAIRVLCFSNKDLAARVVSRTVSEASDLLIVLSGDNDLSKAYIEAQSDPRDFWHRNLANGKLGKKRDKELRDLFADLDEAVPSLSRYRKQEHFDFSMATHPSYQAGVMALVAVVDDPFSNIETTSTPVSTTWISERTLRFTSFCACLSIFAVCLRVFRASEDWLDLENESADHAQKVFLMLYQGAAVGSTLAGSGARSDELDGLLDHWRSRE